MSIYHGPMLAIAASHEVQQRLDEAARSRLARNAPSAPAVYLEPRRKTAARLVDRRRCAAIDWLSAQALQRVMPVGSFEQ
jgi:hypothetical protein